MANDYTMLKKKRAKSTCFFVVPLFTNSTHGEFQDRNSKNLIPTTTTDWLRFAIRL